MTLDLIIPHYNEPYEVVRPMLDMLELQMKANFDEFRVLWINDGEDGRLPELQRHNFPFHLVEMTVPHGGVSAARNYGLEHSDAEWVMFCDCDDTFTSLYSLNRIMSALEDEKGKYNLLWFPYYFDMPNYRATRPAITEFELIFLHGKVIRRSFLTEKNLRFNPELYYTEDTSFLHVLGMEIGPHQIGKLDVSEPLYVYVRRKESITGNPKNLYRNSVGLFHGQIYLAEENLKRQRMDTYHVYVTRAMTDAYVLLCRNDIDDLRDEFDAEAWNYYKDRRESIREAGNDNLERSVVRSLQEFGLTKETFTNMPDFKTWLEAWTRIHEQEESKSK